MSRQRRLLVLGSLLVRPWPIGLVSSAGALSGRLAAGVLRAHRAALTANLRRVVPGASAEELRSLVTAGFASYGRYWAETLRLPTLGADVIDRRFTVEGRQWLTASQEAGFGPIVVLPHLGGWEWAAAWLTRVDQVPVSAVVERLRPDDVFEWFTDLRSSYGIDVIPLGAESMGRLVGAVRAGHVVCLLGDRDISGTGVLVDLFGADASIPLGPAVLALRTGAPIHPTAVYFTSVGHHCVVGPPLWPERSGRLRDDAVALTQRYVVELEHLIRRAPEQWHVLTPIWHGGHEPRVLQ